MKFYTVLEMLYQNQNFLVWINLARVSVYVKLVTTTPRIIFFITEREPWERIADLDRYPLVFDIKLAWITHCWWCTCSSWARSVPGTCCMTILISNNWNMVGCQEHPAWCLWRSAQKAGLWGHRRFERRPGMSRHYSLVAMWPLLLLDQFGLQ